MKPQAEIINSLTFGNPINPTLSTTLAAHSAAMAGLGAGSLLVRPTGQAHQITTESLELS